MHDLIIVGAGPAGITASIYASRKKMDFLVISKDVGGQTLWTANIENYTGFQMIPGTDLITRFNSHLEQAGVNLKENENVLDIESKDGIVSVKTSRGEYQSKTLIIASGKKPRKLGAKGEDEFRNKGVAYCATCDAPVFSNMDVAVIGGGNSAIDAAIQLIAIASKVYIIDVEPELRADAVMVERVKSSPKVTIYSNATVDEIYGDKFVKGMKIIQSGKKLDIALRGIFVEVGFVPSSEFSKNIHKNDNGEITVNCNNETNIPGVFAAGDVTDVTAKQIIVACGEGAKSAISAFQYLIKRKESAKI